LKRHCRNK